MPSTDWVGGGMSKITQITPIAHQISTSLLPSLKLTILFWSSDLSKSNQNPHPYLAPSFSGLNLLMENIVETLLYTGKIPYRSIRSRLQRQKLNVHRSSEANQLCRLWITEANLWPCLYFYTFSYFTSASSTIWKIVKIKRNTETTCKCIVVVWG